MKRNLVFQAGHIMILPDYTRLVQTKSKSYDQVKLKLQAMHISFVLLYPTRLCIIHDAKTVFFDMPKEAWTWLTEQRALMTDQPLSWQSTTPPKGKGHGLEMAKEK
ncbi:hypothetical protein NDU88_004595 [Pleurodeles waltl]|uniref:Uncharacterized protein n=1 Tax=Pleurodeles waltl TaxID=8319 RepID=A0AAV7QF11_PLEWA|nr:hypothetical protein NDU88_004595 [Pleurodeles waltl]